MWGGMGGVPGAVRRFTTKVYYEGLLRRFTTKVYYEGLLRRFTTKVYYEGLPKVAPVTEPQHKHPAMIPIHDDKLFCEARHLQFLLNLEVRKCIISEVEDSLFPQLSNQLYFIVATLAVGHQAGPGTDPTMKNRAGRGVPG
jgi:hypothetical protein